MEIGLAISEFMKAEYNTEEGNSFFFSGGCYILADAVHSLLLDMGMSSQIMAIDDGDHVYVESEGKCYDAGGTFDSADELIAASGIEYREGTISEWSIKDGVIEVTADMVYYKNKLKHYGGLSYE